MMKNLVTANSVTAKTTKQIHCKCPSRSRPEVLQNMCKTGIQKKNNVKEAITLMLPLKTAPCVSKLKQDITCIPIS
jgi:hypothetical protein